MRLPRLLQHLRSPTRRIAGDMIARARAAAKAELYRDAAFLYEEALRLTPHRAAVHVQCGHMLKNVGAYAEAERHYAEADRIRPGDADLMVQFGHLYKLTGRIADAAHAYRRALALRPDWTIPAGELAHLTAAGWHDAPPALPGTDVPAPAMDYRTLRLATSTEQLAPMLAPGALPLPRPGPPDIVHIPRLGRIRPGLWGNGPVLHGVEAIRGHCLSTAEIVEVQVIMAGLTLHRGPPERHPAQSPDSDDDAPWHKYVFNIWYDFGQFVPGRYPIEIRLIDAAGATRSHHDRILIVEPVPESCHPDSDGLIVLPPGDPRPVEVRLTERPTIVHRAERRLFARTPRNILVQRTDQLGDMVASIPAILRLRALFPEARIVGLLTAANADFAGTLSLFDEIVTIDFPDDPVERRRLMTLDDQAALRDRLAPYRFDVAIDLATSGVSRPLLRLSGAPFTMGMGDAAWPWLSAGFDFNTHDPVTRLDVIPHSAKVLAMVEALGAVLTSPSRIIHGEDLTRDILVPLGIAADQSYILLHAGARIGFSHWPHYPALARLLLERTDRHVVLLTENASLGSMLPLELRDSDRFLLIDRRLPFNELDAILSFADVMVGNDSGPKHLAALRGTQVVTLFTNRISYAEWGQEQTGVIMARKVPCAGCQLLHDTDECGKAFACITGIRPDEVLDVVLGLL